MHVAHVATMNAFENKFGTYTGAVRNERTKEVVRERFETMEDAKNFVQAKAYEWFGEGNFAPMYRKNEYFANYWIRVSSK